MSAAAGRYHQEDHTGREGGGEEDKEMFMFLHKTMREKQKTRAHSGGETGEGDLPTACWVSPTASS